MKENEYKLLNTWLERANYLFTHDINFNEIPGEQLISLKELVTLIQTAYSRFKEEYESLEKLDIGKNNNVIYLGITKTLRRTVILRDKSTPTPTSTSWVLFYSPTLLIDASPNDPLYFCGLNLRFFKVNDDLRSSLGFKFFFVSII